MLLAYLDESHTKTYYWMTAVVCADTSIAPLTRSLDEVVKTAVTHNWAHDYRAELHGYSLFHAKDDWTALAQKVRARINVHDQALQAIGASGASIIIRGVHRQGIVDRYVSPRHPHSVVLEHLLESIAIRLTSIGAASGAIKRTQRAGTRPGSWTTSSTPCTSLRRKPAGFSRPQTSWHFCTTGSTPEPTAIRVRSRPTRLSGPAWLRG